MYSSRRCLSARCCWLYIHVRRQQVPVQGGASADARFGRDAVLVPIKCWLVGCWLVVGRLTDNNNNHHHQHHHHQVTGRSEAVRPNVVVYDPALLASLPASVRVPSLFNGFAHCAAALQDSKCDPVTRMVAEEGIKRICAGLIARDGPEDATATSL